MKTNYLPHLDGLRATAFTFVLLFHFKVGGAHAGYLGVDMFLVLSGFLMTRIILRDIRAATFNMRHFMLRRFWRLYPTLLVTATCTLLVSLLLYSTKLQKRVGESTLAALLFLSNHYFQSTTGYFDIGTELKPLLHTWSLSLEEQFYFIWPLFLLLIYNVTGVSRTSRSRLNLGIAFLFAMSISLIFARRNRGDHSITFFLLPSRIFEFTVGGLLSLVYDELVTLIQKSSMQDISAIFGTILVTYPVFRPPPSTLPGPHTMPTLLGTMLLMATPTSLIANYIMASSPARFVGKLSYSGYLVHWPIWVFMLFTFGPNLNKPLLFIMTFILAFALHHGVENKFRHGRSVYKSALIVSLMLATMCIAYFSVITKGFPNRTIQDGYLLTMAHAYNKQKCHNIPRNHSLFAKIGKSDPPRACYIGGNPALLKKLPISLVVVGSSFSHHLIASFRLLSLRRKEGYLFLHHESCPLLSKPKHAWPWVQRRCLAENLRRKAFLRVLSPARVLIADYWDLRFGEGNSDVSEKINGPRGVVQYLKSECTELKKLGHIPAIAGDPPVFGERPFEAVRSCNQLRGMRIRRWMARLRGREPRCKERFVPDAMQVRFMKEMESVFVTDPVMQGCYFHDQFPSFCNMGKDQTCILQLADAKKAVAPKGVDLTKRKVLDVYWEGMHLNDIGSWQTGPRIARFLDWFPFPKLASNVTMERNATKSRMMAGKR